MFKKMFALMQADMRARERWPHLHRRRHQRLQASSETNFVFPTVYPLQSRWQERCRWNPPWSRSFAAMSMTFDETTVTCANRRVVVPRRVGEFHRHVKAQDALYRDLTAHPDIVWAL